MSGRFLSEVDYFMELQCEWKFFCEVDYLMQPQCE